MTDKVALTNFVMEMLKWIEQSGFVYSKYIGDPLQYHKYTCLEWDSNLGLSRMAVFEDCQATALATRPLGHHGRYRSATTAGYGTYYQIENNSELGLS